uniref:Aspartocin n=1 Tax=Squalus acanthias TaxID=7797 RepID=OXYA_SQUAC|nr:RecName: Full=Aspartocin; AltName: Full=Aspargtocin [Squalus acanthias]prf//720633A aspartocin [Squalus acanthias]
CYINNCPLG